MRPQAGDLLMIGGPSHHRLAVGSVIALMEGWEGAAVGLVVGMAIVVVVLACARALDVAAPVGE